MKKILHKNRIMKFKLALYAHLFIHFFRQVFHLKCEISIDWFFLKPLGKLQIGEIFFYKKSVLPIQFNLKGDFHLVRSKKSIFFCWIFRIYELLKMDSQKDFMKKNVTSRVTKV